MQKFAREKLNEIGLMTIQNINQPVETLSGGQRQGVAVARAAAFARRVVIMDEPTAALGVKESRRVLELILDVKKRGLPIILISHNMPHVFEVADRIHIHRLGRRLAVIDPKKVTMSDAVAMMTGAMAPPRTRWRRSESGACSELSPPSSRSTSRRRRGGARGGASAHLSDRRVVNAPSSAEGPRRPSRARRKSHHCRRSTDCRHAVRR